MFFWKELGPWFANPGLSDKGVYASQKLNLVVEVKRKL